MLRLINQSLETGTEDLLSKVNLELIFVKKMMLNSINQSLEIDTEDLLTEVNLDKKLIYWDKTVYYNKKLYISVFLCDDIIAKHYNNLLADYFNYNKTLELLIRKYLWLYIASEVKEYVKICTICRWSKALRYKSYDQLASLSSSIELWSNIIMNFIV